MRDLLERQIDQALGRAPADLVIRNARLLNLVTGELEPGDIAVCGSTIVGTLDSYRGREEIDRYSHRATFEEIEHNKFNLNIPRYVDTFEPEPEIDVQAVQNEIRELDRQLAETRAQMNRYLQELGIEI